MPERREIHPASPKVVLGLPLYGRHDHARQAIASLLAQSHEPLTIVVCDDGPGPRPDLADLLGDPRVTYRLNESRLGLVENWRQVFDLSRRLHPDARYFAWASDHDVWEADWARSLLHALELTPAAVLAYPRVTRIEADGERVLKPMPSGTVGVADRLERLRRAYSRLAPGDMIYGLFRTAALERCGAFPRVVAPDRLLLAELSLQGAFLGVPRPLWSRRREARFSLERQRGSLFGERVPWHAALPWWLQHAATFVRDVAVRDEAALGPSRAAEAAALHAVLAARRAIRRSSSRSWNTRRLRWGARAGRWFKWLRARVRV